MLSFEAISWQIYEWWCVVFFLSLSTKIFRYSTKTLRERQKLFFWIVQRSDQLWHHVSIINESRNDEMFAKFLRTLKTSFFSFLRLCLKIKTFVMFLRNLYFKKNLCNEIRLMITRISRRILKTRILNEELDEEIRLISRINLFNTKKELSWIVRWKQFLIHFISR
jgi:hypothetical protein